MGGAEYRVEGPEHLKVVGETEFVRDAAIDRGQGKTEIAGISPMQTSLQTWTFCEKLWKLTRRPARVCFGVSDTEVRMTRIKAFVG